MYQIELKKSAEKQVNKQQPHIKKAFYNWVENDLTTTPHKANDGKITNMFYEDKEVYKKRFGSFRALFTINENTVVVDIFKFKSRGDIYKK